MNDKNIDTYAGMAELRNTIGEALLYLTDHPADGQVRSDTQAGLSALREKMEQSGSMTRNLRAIWKDIENGLGNEEATSRSDFCSMEEKFRHLFEKKLTKELAEQLKQYPVLEEEQADSWYTYLSHISPEDPDNANLMFTVSEKTTYTRPEESYLYSLLVLEYHPGFLGGKELPHPGYRYQGEEQREFTCCPVCGGTGAPWFRAFSYRMVNFSNPHLPFRLWMRCEKCRTMYAREFPEAFLELSRHSQMVYPREERYYSTAAQTNSNVLSIWGEVLNRIRREYTAGKRLLEVGIGKGELLAVALELGYHPQGVEILQEEAQKAADLLGIPVWSGDFLMYDAQEKYDVIMMGDVIEHVTAPEDALHKAYELLEQDGVLWLSTPNYESAFSRFYKFEDPMWMEPYHITYFCYESLANLADKCGFVVEEYHISKRYNGSMELFLKKK